MGGARTIGALSSSPWVYWKALYRLPLIAAAALACFLYVCVTGDRRGVRLWALFASRVCRRRIVFSGAAPDPAARLLIANHVSYVDLVPIFQLWPACLPVAQREVRSWPLIGRLVRHRVIFVDETDQGSRRRARDQMRKAWRSGRSVLVFPEGVIARRRGRFRVGCFEEAIGSGVAIQGARICYQPELLAALNGRLFEERFFWILSQDFEIRVEVFPAETATGDPASLAARWEARLLAREEQPGRSVGTASASS